ncbi:2OG-Fe dioxygenase family protein [Psychromonas sp. SP041]|uniref:2OG-Fe dioxygenase family protein n=1 Tax=Psychromonas sp. SP041 TaxID=1365007 RepID=UPI0010C7DF7A|nr:2OG-Fe dioxygenase family protein [Psychromonas sp. SP041]
MERIKNNIVENVMKDGFFILDKNFRDYAGVNRVFENEISESELNYFSNSWNDLRIDKYMSDNGTYRLRRHSVFTAIKFTQNFIVKPNTPHFQAVNYNTLNGGFERWYEPVMTSVINGNAFNSILHHALVTFNEIERLKEDSSDEWNEWFIEAHQFRIIASDDDIGLPTPEGIHKDGVSYVFMKQIKRENIAGGESTIYTNSKKPIKSRLLLENDIVYIDDTKVMHSVSEISQHDRITESFRDMLVLTFKKK